MTSQTMLRADGSDGGPGFPALAGQHLGMSLRDFFAAQAIQAIIQTTQHASIGLQAAMAYETADAMLAERIKKNGRP